jgi:hypothetical protein
MAVRSELAFEYNESSFVVSATCSRCAEKMPAPDPTVTLTRDRVLWFAQHFVEHKKQRHPAEIVISE